MTEILITSSVLIFALLLIRKLFSGSLSRRIQYALWALVLVRLLVPVQLPEMDFSVLSATKPVEKTVNQSIAEQSIYVPVAQAPLEEQPKARLAKPENTLIPVGQTVWIAETEHETAVQYKRISHLTVLTWIWIAGGCVVGAFLLFANLRFWLWLRRVRKPYEAADCKLRVYLVEAGLPSPCLFGLFRPAVYLTPAALESETKLRHVLAHESTHARHLDHLWTFLRGVCLAVYWFDPLVWAAAAAAKTDCELACDEGALAQLSDDDRIPYGKTLLSLVPVRQTVNPLLATTMAAGKRQLKDRFTRIAKRSRQTVAAVVAVAVLVVAISACTFTGGNSGGEKVIHILTDLGNNSERERVPLTQFSAQATMNQFLANEDILPEGYTVEVEVMPTDEEEFKSALTRLRTEIMSGKGPDIYVLSSANYGSHYPQERVFPNTKKAMEDGYFLNLDDYMDKAQFMEFDDLNPTVMAAGCTSAGRFVLPTRFTFNAFQVREPVSDPEVGWFDVVNGTDEVLASGYALAASFWMFQSIFEETVDAETKTLTFSEEELYDAVAMTLKWYRSDPANFLLEETVQVAPIDFSNYKYAYWDAEGNEDAVYLPMRNRAGGVSATVTSYIAINKNTPYPDEAFRVVDLMMSKEFQSGQKLGAAPGTYVYDDFLQESTPMDGVLQLEDEMYPIYRGLRDQITDARIMHHIDQAMFDLYENAQENGMTPGDELKKYVSEEYRKMVLMAGEL